MFSLEVFDGVCLELVSDGLLNCVDLLLLVCLID